MCPLPEPVDGAATFDEIAALIDGVRLLDALTATFRRFAGLPPGAAEVLALYVVFTHAIDALRYAPRLLIKGPVSEIGKSRVLEIMAELVRNPRPAGKLSDAGIYRSPPGSTILVDNGDLSVRNNKALTLILDVGHSRATAYVQLAFERLPCFFPVIISLIGDLDRTVESRSWIIEMQAALPGEMPPEGEDFDLRDHLDDLHRLHDQTERFVAANLKLIEAARPKNTPGMRNRLGDNARPLRAIAEVVGGHWPQTAVRAMTNLVNTTEEIDPGRVLLADIRDILARTSLVRLSSEWLASELRQIEDHWPDLTTGKLAAMLRVFKTGLPNPPKIRPQMFRDVGRGYLRYWFTDPIRRYVPGAATPATPATEPTDVAPVAPVAPASESPSESEPVPPPISEFETEPGAVDEVAQPEPAEPMKRGGPGRPRTRPYCAKCDKAIPGEARVIHIDGRDQKFHKRCGQVVWDSLMAGHGR
jgi:hypothetical protein